MINIFKESKKVTDEKIEEIKKITSLITDTWFANAFHKQANKLNNGRIFWGAVIIIWTLSLVYILFSLFVTLDTSTWNRVLLELNVTAVVYRLTLTSPFLFLIWFAVTQYWRDTKLNDKYEFKAATASTISHHVDFLKKEFPKNNDIIIDFTKDTFSKIYKEPYKDEEENKKINELIKEVRDIKNKSNNSWFHFDKVLKTAKELKELFPGNDNLKEVLNILKSMTK
jgi:replicative superfamily II helicase